MALATGDEFNGRGVAVVRRLAPETRRLAARR